MLGLKRWGKYFFKKDTYSRCVDLDFKYIYLDLVPILF